MIVHPDSAVASSAVPTAVPALVIVAGPTASGKSHLALRLAQRFSGEIVNADSLQLYRGFDIGTAKPTMQERTLVRHHLIDVLDPQTVFSAGDFARLARETVSGIAAQGRLPLMVGGTGFYVRAFLDGLPELPARDERVRAQLTVRERQRPGSLYRLLRRLEPEAARQILPADIQKQIRALEVRMLTGAARPALDSARPLEGFRVLQLGLSPDREALAQLIFTRTQRMFEEGLVGEVRQLLASGLSGEEKPFESIGYRQVLSYLRGELTLEQASESVEIETRQYAKRQRTWFRRDDRIVWLEGFGTQPEIEQAAVERVAAFLASPTWT